MASISQPKTVRAIHANRGVEAQYRKALLSLIEEMVGSVEYWLQAAYRKSPPRMSALVEMASDATPSDDVLSALGRLKKRWLKAFRNDGASIAEKYVTRLYKTTDSAFRTALRDAGMSVEFKMSPAMRDAFNATISENVSLIRSIPEQYLQQVEGIVTRSYSVGGDLHTMVKELKELHPKLGRRAELIARDQCSKAHAVVNRARMLELGITDAIWMHSHAGKVPRPAHVAANEKRFKVAEGCLISGQYVLPGQEINCRCTCRAVLPW
jgi:SPP1 gp7 family putative phage head morphogenesis protein